MALYHGTLDWRSLRRSGRNRGGGKDFTVRDHTLSVSPDSVPPLPSTLLQSYTFLYSFHPFTPPPRCLLLPRLGCPLLSPPYYSASLLFPSGLLPFTPPFLSTSLSTSLSTPLPPSPSLSPPQFSSAPGSLYLSKDTHAQHCSEVVPDPRLAGQGGNGSRSIHRSAQTVIRGPSIGEWPLGMLCCMGGLSASPPHSGRCAVLVCTHPACITSAGEP